MRLLKYITVALLVGLSLSGCATQRSYHAAQNHDPVKIDRLLLMPVDVELSLLTAGGVEEPNAQWTAQAERHIAGAVREILKDNNAQLIRYGGRIDAGGVPKEHSQIIKLHNAVGGAILKHKYVQGAALPTKQGRFDWTLGSSVNMLRKKYGADHALFVFMRDSYASAGRTAAIIAGSLIGAHVQGGTQVGFASLVDLKTGDVVWFNVLARQHGDLRTADAARETVTTLLAGLPK